MSTRSQTNYQELLRDPCWQRKRLEVMQRAAFKCERCQRNDLTLNVHHTVYRSGHAPWQYEDSELQCLCEDCHMTLHLLAEAMSKEVDERLEEAIEGAYIILTQTANVDTRTSAARVMANLVATRSPEQVERMERAKGLR